MKHRRMARVLANGGYNTHSRDSPECGMEHRRSARVLANGGYNTRSRYSPECGLEHHRSARVLVNGGYNSRSRYSPECGAEHRRSARVLANGGYNTRSRYSPECGMKHRRMARVLANGGYNTRSRNSPECGMKHHRTARVLANCGYTFQYQIYSARNSTMPSRSVLQLALPLLCFTVLFLNGVLLQAADAIKFRTDGNSDTALPWYQLVDGKFPPENSAHAISGELMQVDHLERRFQLRVDRNDSQQAGFLDLAIESSMLPYGSIYYHGAPAALQDIPLGTHLHGLFYVKAANDNSPAPKSNRRVSSEVAFKRCFRLEDDFSFYSRQKQFWKIDAVDLAERKLTVTLYGESGALEKPKVFDLLSSTLAQEGAGFANLGSLKVGQTVQFNITWATLYGPGRIAEIWIDEPSRQLAASQQLERHRNHIRERGLPGWIDVVDDEAQVVTITFFGGVDPKLFDELTGINEEPHGWPFSKREDNPKAPKGGIAVALPSLMTYDPVNDRKGGNILQIGKTAIEPGSSGVQIKVKCCMLLEGHRPGAIVRFYPATWKVNALPQEEQFHGRE
jgi:hypothetical protein